MAAKTGGGMDPVTIAMITSSLFGGLGGLLGGDDDSSERRPFEGELEAQSMMDRGRNVHEGANQAFGEALGRGVHLRSAYAQQPPTFTGGGLPFPIGVSAMDPALADPNLLRLEGIPFNDMLAAWEQRPRSGAGPQATPSTQSSTQSGASPAAQLRAVGANPYDRGHRAFAPLNEEEQMALQLLGG